MTVEEAIEVYNKHTPVALTHNGVAEKVMVVGVSNTTEEALVAFPIRLDDEEIKLEWFSLEHLI